MTSRKADPPLTTLATLWDEYRRVQWPNGGGFAEMMARRAFYAGAMKGAKLGVAMLEDPRLLREVETELEAFFEALGATT